MLGGFLGAGIKQSVKDTNVWTLLNFLPNSFYGAMKHRAKCFPGINSFQRGAHISPLYFIDEETEAQKGQVPCQGHTAWKRHSWDLSPGGLALEPHLLNLTSQHFLPCGTPDCAHCAVSCFLHLTVPQTFPHNSCSHHLWPPHPPGGRPSRTAVVYANGGKKGCVVLVQGQEGSVCI